MRLIMPVISKTRIDQVIYRLTQDQIAVHTRLKNINPLIGSFLLKPREEGQFIIWELENSQIDIDKITEYTNLNELEKSKVHEQLEIIKALIKGSGDDPKILDIPSFDSIKLLETNLGQKVVVDSWGHLPFDSSKGVSIINFTPKPSQKLVQVDLSFHYYDKSPASGYDITVYNNGFGTSHTTDNKGMITLGNQMVGKDFQIEVKNKLETIIVNKDNNVFEFELPYYTDVTVKVLDQATNTPSSNYTVFLSSNSNRLNGYSDSNGLIVFKNILAGEKIEISDSLKTLIHNVTKDNNYIELRVEKEKTGEPVSDQPLSPEEGKKQIFHEVFFTVYDLDGKKMLDYDLNIQQGNNIIPTNKDLDNTYRKKINSDELNMDCKSIGIVKVKESGKELTYKCKFQTQPDVTEYSFQIKKVRNWWWLLWLIPLILSLLIVLGKDIHIKVSDEKGIAISNAGVNMQYHYKSLFNFNSFQFLTTDSMKVDVVTDSLGLVNFENNPTTVFDFIFKLRRNAKINIMVDTSCYIPTAALIKFYKVFTTHELIVQNKKSEVEIYVKESNSEAPILDANVDLTIGGMKTQYSTDQNGKVLVSDVDACAKINALYAFKNYPDFGKLYSDTLKNSPIQKGNLITLYINEPEPCRDTLRRGGVEGDRIFLATPNANNEYYLWYNFVGIPDRLLIYSYPDRKLIRDTRFQRGIGEYRFKPNDVCDGCKMIYLEIQTNDKDTGWEYNFKCDN